MVFTGQNSINEFKKAMSEGVKFNAEAYSNDNAATSNIETKKKEGEENYIFIDLKILKDRQNNQKEDISFAINIEKFKELFNQTKLITN